MPIGGRLEVRVRKRRLWCDTASCDRVTFTQITDQLGLRARVTTRLAGRVVDALATEPRSVSSVGAEVGVSWLTVVRLVAGTVTACTTPTESACADWGLMSAGSAECGSGNCPTGRR